MALNMIAICGRLVRDPEYKTTGDGTGYCNFTVAVDDDFKDKDGKKQTDFIDCTAWRKTAEYVTTYQTKGCQVTVAGRLKSRKWQDKDGNNRVSWFIRADSVNGVGSRGDGQKPDSGAQGGYSAPQQYSAPAAAYGAQNGFGGFNGYGSGGYVPPVSDNGDYAMLTDDDSQLPF